MVIMLNDIFLFIFSSNFKHIGHSLGLKEKLEWSIRYKIAIGIAEGLRYLHEGCQRRIIHRDIKAANILLTQDFEPQVFNIMFLTLMKIILLHHLLLLKWY